VLGQSGTTWLGIGEFIAGTVACAAGAPYCVIAGLTIIAVNATVSAESGASFSQVAESVTLSAFVGLITFGVGQSATIALTGADGSISINAQVFVGALSSAVGGALSGVARGGQGLGDSILQGALVGAWTSGVTIGIQSTAVVSQASAVQAAQRGGGSGEQEQSVEDYLRSQGYPGIGRGGDAYLLHPTAGASSPALADLSDFVDAIKGIADWGARCMSGPCADFQYRVLEMANDPNRPSVGAQAEVSVVTSFLSRGGGTYGFNFQLNLDVLHDSGRFFYYTPPNSISSGSLLGADIGLNLAYANGPWRGLFDNAAASVGPVSASAFRSPGWTGNGQGYAGLSLGSGRGPSGGGIYQTNYVPIFGD
jgi:hypothetical protein